MELISGLKGVVKGYAAFNFPPDGWKGVIEDNVYCKEYRETSEEALQDAEKLYKGVK